VIQGTFDPSMSALLVAYRLPVINRKSLVSPSFSRSGNEVDP
jgi:hypothetical protein